MQRATHFSFGVLALGALAAVAAGQSFVPVLVGTPVNVDSGVTTNTGGVSVAYNSRDAEYRIFWFDSRITGENDVYAQRLAPLGELRGENTPIAVGPASRTGTAAAYDPTNNDYLVCWQYQGGSPGSPGFNHAYGGIVSAAAGLVTPETDLSNGGLEATLAFDGDQFFLEARNFAGGGPTGIRGQPISLTGVPIGAGVTLASAGAPAPAGQIAYSAASQCYLATWRDQVDSNLKGRIVNRDGSFGAGPFVISTTFPGGSLAASVAARGSGEFLVVFSTFMGGPVIGQFVGCDGSLVGAPLTLVNTSARVDPYVAYDARYDVFLLATHDYDSGSLTVVLISGTAVSAPLTLTAATDTGAPRVTASTDLGGFVVAWVDNANYPTSADVLAQIVGVATHVLGDVNCDGVVDFLDINPFVLLLSDPGAWHAAFPYCPESNGDCNGDGRVDFLDINPFVALLSH